MTLEDMRDDALSLLDVLDIKKCVFLGHSMGGRVAIYTALTQVSCCFFRHLRWSKGKSVCLGSSRL